MTAAVDQATTAAGLRERLQPLARHPRWTSWVLTSLALGAYLASRPTRSFLYDASRYVELSGRFTNLWSLTDQSDTYRGYAFPWLLRLVRELAGIFGEGPHVAVRLLTLILVPLLLCVVVPSIVQRVSTHTHVTVGRILLMNVLFFASWHNDLVQPLSDLPAAFFMSVGILAVLASRHVVVAIGAGAALGLASNVRPAYVLGAVVAVAALWVVESDRRRLVARTAAMIGGALLVLVPQAATNVRHHDQFSVTPVASSDLTLFQLGQGLALDRYDTYVGADVQRPPGMRFENRAMQDAIGRGADARFDSIGAYVRFAAEHPGDVASAYVRHLVNGLDTRFGGTYVEDLTVGRSVWPIVNFLILTSAVSVALVRWTRRQETVWRSPTTYALVVLAASCATSIVAAMEVRFLLPLHLTLVAVFCLTVSRSDLPARTRVRALAVGGVLAATALFFSLTASTMGQLQPTPLKADGSMVVPEGP